MEAWKKYLAALAILCGLLYTSYWYGKHSNPPETIVQIEEKIREKIVQVEVEKKQTKKNTTTHIIKKPDGTTETTITENKETTSESSTKTKSETESEKNTVVQTKPDVLSKYRLGAMAESKILDSEKRGDLMYSASAGMRVIGPWWLDAKVGVSEKTLGLGVSLEF